MASLEADNVDTVAALKSYLARVHFRNKYSKYQLRLVRADDPSELQEDESITAPMELQLVLMSHLPPNEERDRGFIMSCRGNRLKRVEKALKGLQNPNLEPQHANCLSEAVDMGNYELVELLLEARADPEGRNLEVLRPMHRAAYCGNTRLLELLLHFGADKEAISCGGLRPLHCAVWPGDWHSAEFLLRARAEVDCADSQGRRPLHLAVKQGFLESARLLLEHGADKDGTTSEGWTPLHFAAKARLSHDDNAQVCKTVRPHNFSWTWVLRRRLWPLVTEGLYTLPPFEAISMLYDSCYVLVLTKRRCAQVASGLCTWLPGTVERQ